jgi:hypothetical protein
MHVGQDGLGNSCGGGGSHGLSGHHSFWLDSARIQEDNIIDGQSCNNNQPALSIQVFATQELDILSAASSSSSSSTVVVDLLLVSGVVVALALVSGVPPVDLEPDYYVGVAAASADLVAFVVATMVGLDQ